AQAFAAARTRDADAGVAVEKGAMAPAGEGRAVFGEELVAAAVERDRNVGADVHVRPRAVFRGDENPFHTVEAEEARLAELHHPSGVERLRPGDVSLAFLRAAKARRRLFVFRIEEP